MIYIVLNGSLVFLAVQDLCTGKLSNFFTYGMIVYGLIWSLVNQTISFWLISVFLALVLSVALYALHQIGAGDVKLITGVFSMTGFWFGASALCAALISMALVVCVRSLCSRKIPKPARVSLGIYMLVGVVLCELARLI